MSIFWLQFCLYLLMCSFTMTRVGHVHSSDIFCFFWHRFSGFVERYWYIFLYLPSAELWTWSHYIVTSVTFSHPLFMWCAQTCFCIYVHLQVSLVKLCTKYRCTFFVITVLQCKNAWILSYLMQFYFNNFYFTRTCCISLLNQDLVISTLPHASVCHRNICSDGQA